MFSCHINTTYHWYDLNMNLNVKRKILILSFHIYHLLLIWSQYVPKYKDENINVFAWYIYYLPLISRQDEPKYKKQNINFGIYNISLTIDISSRLTYI
jgi:hypothetical protein